MDTKIYSVFPACGKTWMYKQQENYNLKILDSDSSDFSWIRLYDQLGRPATKLRNPDFPNNYIKHIKENIGKYDCIFVSSHASVREALDKEGIDFIIVYPNINCKAEWVGRCFIREKNGEDGCGAEAMYNNWEQWVSECEETGAKHKEIVLKAREYLCDHFIRYCGNRKIIGMRAVNTVEFEPPITIDEWFELPSYIVEEVDGILSKIGYYAKGRGGCAPIYEGDMG